MQNRGSIQALSRCASQQFVYHALARNTHQERQIKQLELLQVVQQGIVLVQRLAETETGIQNDVLYTHQTQPIDPFRKIAHDVAHQVGIIGLLLHRLGCTTHVHHDIGDMQVGYRGKHRLIQTASGNIVDDSRPILFDTPTGHIGPKGIDRDGQIGIMTVQQLQRQRQPTNYR